MEKVFDCLSGAQYFTTVDMQSGYHHIEVAEDHKERTAFTLGPFGLWEFNTMPFGLTNHRLMTECLGHFNMNIVLFILMISSYSEELLKSTLNI